MAHTAPKHQATTNHARLLEWVEEVAALTQPDDVHWCDGSAAEYDYLAQTLVEAGTFERLSEAKRPTSYLALSDPDDVARVEDRTFICSKDELDAGPTNNWREPEEMRVALKGLFEGAGDHILAALIRSTIFQRNWFSDIHCVGTGRGARTIGLDGLHLIKHRLPDIMNLSVG